MVPDACVGVAGWCDGSVCGDDATGHALGFGLEFEFEFEDGRRGECLLASQMLQIKKEKKSGFAYELLGGSWSFSL